MSPRVFTQWALRLYPWRWWFLAVSVCGMAAAMGAFAFGSPAMAGMAALLMGPVIVVPWALLCLCTWFHPQRGTMRPQSVFMRRLPGWLQTGLRWYGALFLVLFAFVGAVVGPVFWMVAM